MTRQPINVKDLVSKGSEIDYLCKQGSAPRWLPATVMKVHHDDVEPYFTILVAETGRERPTRPT